MICPQGNCTQTKRLAHPVTVQVRTPNRLPFAAVALLFLTGFGLAGCGEGRAQKPVAGVSNSVMVAQDGLPNTLVELNDWYTEPPPGKNAATFFSQGLEALQLSSKDIGDMPLLGKGKLPAAGAPLAQPVKMALTRIVNANADAFRFFAQGAQLEQCRYPVELARGLDAIFPHVPKLRNAGLLAELAAVLHSESKQPQEAANDVLIAFDLARSLQAEPALLSQLIRVAGISTALAALEQSLNRANLPARALNPITKALEKMEEWDGRGEGFTRALVGERVSGRALFADRDLLLRAMTGPGVHLSATGRAAMKERAQDAGKLTVEKLYFENTFQELMAARAETFPERLKSDGLIRQKATEATNQNLIVNGVLLGGLTRRCAQEAEALACCRLGLIAIALERFRAAHDNKYPAVLSELAPDYLGSCPTDPFDGQPLRYRKQAAGYQLYSIGPDLQDNSGTRMSGHKGDLVFAVVVPPP